MARVTITYSDGSYEEWIITDEQADGVNYDLITAFGDPSFVNAGCNR